MKPIYLIPLAVAATAVANPVSAACRAPDGANSTWCQSCGNLEQNPSRGHDLAWNKFLQDHGMQLELSFNGATTLYLTDPPHSSPGVLYYTVVIEDPQFNVANSESYAEAYALMQQYSAGLHFEDGIPGGAFSASFDIQQHIEHAVTSSVTTGSSPYIMRMFDSRGNPVNGGTVEQPRSTPAQQLALAGTSDLHPDDQYRNEACEHVDPRLPAEGSSGSGGGSGDPGDGYDDYYAYDNHWWDMEEAWGGAGIHCVGDFSDPAGSGVICFIH
jgi:hypothetical protein